MKSHSWIIDTRSTFTTAHVRGSYSCTKAEHVGEFIQKRNQSTKHVKEFVIILYDELPKSVTFLLL